MHIEVSNLSSLKPVPDTTLDNFRLAVGFQCADLGTAGVDFL
jgi:hypothetical protein